MKYIKNKILFLIILILLILLLIIFKNKESFSNTNNKLNNIYQITKIKKNIFNSEYPIFVNFYTGDNGYRKYSDKLIKSLKKFNLPYYIIEINSKGDKWTRICQQKPYILLDVMNKYPNKNVVWVDADAIIEKKPELFKNIDKSLGVHYIGGNEFASGTLFFKNNKISRNIINDWIKDNEKNINAWDQVVLGKIINSKYKKHEYCSIFDKKGYKNIDRVISHWQASRELKYKKRIEKFTNNVTSLNFKLNDGGGNFGDSVNKIFWKKMTGNKIINNNTNTHYLTTGSIMTLANNKSIIFGTGFISEKSNLGGGGWILENKKLVNPTIIAVRGPKTRKKLLEMNVQCPKNYGDPLILFPCIYTPKNIQTNKVGLIPHYIDYNSNNVKILIDNLEKNNYKTTKINIKVGEDYKKFIDEINECDTIISSSLHGVIMGLVYKKKTIFTQFSNKVIGKEFKFYDFFESVDIEYNIKNVFDVILLRNYINIDYNKLNALSIKLIKICPFIKENKKKILLKNYKEYYNI